MSESRIPPAIAAVPEKPPLESAAAGAESALSDRHKEYIERFRGWLLGLNRHDFLQAKKLLDGMMHAYAKHTMRIHSPPARQDNDVPGKTSDGTATEGLPDPQHPA